MVGALKVILSATAIAICAYGILEFGPSIWPLLFLVLGVFILVSLFVPRFHLPALIIGRIMGVLSLLALALLMLAATTGGSFRLSASNELIAVALAIMSFAGCALFLARTRTPHA